MKRYLILFSILVLAAGIAYAADSSSVAPRGSTAIPDRFGGIVQMLGKTPRTTQCTVDDTARGIDNLVATGGGTYLGGSDNTLTPIAVTGSCVSATTLWSFQTTPTTSVGHQVTAGSSFQFSGPDAVGYLKGIRAAGDNASCAITLWY